MSQSSHQHHGPLSPEDPPVATAGDATRPRLGRPSSTPTHAASPVHSATHPASIASESTSTSSKRARPVNAVLPGHARPKTMYPAVTWKEGLDEFNRRLRRGSMSQDGNAPGESIDSHVQAVQYAQGDRDSSDHPSTPLANDDVDERSRLLGDLNGTKLDRDHMSSTVPKVYGTLSKATDNGQGQGQGHDLRHMNEQHDPSNGTRSPPEPAFPPTLNPALAATAPSSKLGVFSGVFVPCVLSIWGIILFLRFGFIIGQAGVLGTLGMFIVGYLINIFTTLSLSAISTNGTVRGGGVYYLLSRSLGPEFGGSIGLMFFIGSVLACGMNVLGFVEPLIANFGETSGTVYKVLPEGKIWDFVYGTILLISCTLVCLVGSKLFSRASLVLALIILLSTISIFVSFALVPPFSIPERNIEYTSFSLETLRENLWPSFTVTTGPDGGEMLSFQTVFGVLFPACTGILAGASMSGDLENPSRSIPKGTLWAVASTFSVYTVIVILMGGSISRSTMYTDLSVLQDISISPLYIASGALAASIFAVLGSVIGSAKILQAIARDNLLPFISVFGQGTLKTDEPTLAVLLTYILAQFCLFLTDMNMIATFVSLITLLTFLILNFACFLLKIGSAPNFRPNFRYFHWWTAFAGMVLCGLVMCFVDLGKSMLSALVVAMIFIWIHYWSPPKRWGDVTQSLIYHQVRKYLLRLDSRKEHVKFWRPQILLLVHHPRTEYHLIQFCNHLKKGALYVLGHVILGDLRDVLAEYRRQQGSWLKFVDVLHIKAFVNISVADSVRVGARNLLIGTGLGGMRPNIVVLGSFNTKRYLLQKQLQQQLEQDQGQGKGFQSALASHKMPLTNLLSDNHSSNDPHTLLNIPMGLPIDNIRVEAPISITDYVSIIEDVLSLNKAVAIGYGFENMELPDEYKSQSRLFSFGSGLFSSASSTHKLGESKKKKYIDLWPMQMSSAPIQLDPLLSNKRVSREMDSFSPTTPAGGPYASAIPNKVPEVNLTNFDSYAMVLQMGCILHMVPHWKEKFILRVMVFVEYREDVEEEKERLNLLLENLRIPAEVNVICLDDGDSDTYEQLVRGQGDHIHPMDSPQFSAEPEGLGVMGTDDMMEGSAFTRERSSDSPYQQHEPTVMEEDEEEGSDKGQRQCNSDRGISTSQQSSQEVGPYSEAAGRASIARAKATGSSYSPLIGNGQSHALRSPPNKPTFQPSGPLTQRRRTVSNLDHIPPKLHMTKGPSPLRVNTALSPRLRQGAPMTISTAQSGSHHVQHGSIGAGRPPRRRATVGPGAPGSPMESRLGTSAPLGASMNFRIAVPLPRQYFDLHGSNSESESDSISSEDEDEYRLGNEDAILYGTSVTGAFQEHRRSLHLSPNPNFLSNSINNDNNNTINTNNSGQRSLAHHGSFPRFQVSQPQSSSPSHQVAASSRTEQPVSRRSSLAHTSLGSSALSGLGIQLGAQKSSSTKNDSHADQEEESSHHPQACSPYQHQQQHSFSGFQSSPNAPSLLDLAPRRSSRHIKNASTSSLSSQEPTHLPLAVTSNPWATSSESGSMISASYPSLPPPPPQQQHLENPSSTRASMSSSWIQAPPESGDSSRTIAPPRETMTSQSLDQAGHVQIPIRGDDPQRSCPSWSNLGAKEEGQESCGDEEQEEEDEEDDPETAYPSYSRRGSAAIQFDDLTPEAQLMILNELMQIHSSTETTSIIFTTVPAPGPGTCLSEQSSLAYMEQLDSLMDGIQVPVLLIHAKSLTVTMTL